MLPDPETVMPRRQDAIDQIRRAGQLIGKFVAGHVHQVDRIGVHLVWMWKSADAPTFNGDLLPFAGSAIRRPDRCRPRRALMAKAPPNSLSPATANAAMVLRHYPARSARRVLQIVNESRGGRSATQEGNSPAARLDGRRWARNATRISLTLLHEAARRAAF